MKKLLNLLWKLLTNKYININGQQVKLILTGVMIQMPELNYIGEEVKKSGNKLKEINYSKNYIFPNTNYTKPLYGLCPTLTTRSGVYFHSTYNRYLTTKECLLLQGFPMDFKQVVSNSRIYKQIGNSMSVNVIIALFNKIFQTTIYKQLLEKVVQK